MQNFNAPTHTVQEVSTQTVLYTVPSGKVARLLFIKYTNASLVNAQTVSLYKSVVSNNNLLSPYAFPIGIVGDDTQVAIEDLPRELVFGDSLIIVPSGELTIEYAIAEGDE